MANLAKGFSKFLAGSAIIVALCAPAAALDLNIGGSDGISASVDVGTSNGLSADVDASVRKVRELGGAVFMEPTDIEPGRFAVVADPAGATFNLITMKPELTGS